MSVKLLQILDATGLESFAPFVRLLRGDDATEQFRRIAMNFGAPLVAILVFLAGWSLAAQSITTKYGHLPSPSDVWVQAGVLWEGHLEFAAMSLGLAISLVLQLTEQRLRATTPSLARVAEMLGTSLLLPFVSVYWRLRGALRFRVLFL